MQSLNPSLGNHMKLHKFMNWRLALLFVVAGPLIGLASAVVIVTFKHQDASGLVADLPVLVAPAYFFGGLPALFTGLILPAAYSVSSIGRPYPLLAYALVAAVTGGLMSLLLGKVVFNAGSGFVLAPTAAFSAVVCAVIAVKLGLGPDKFPKPSPEGA